MSEHPNNPLLTPTEVKAIEALEKLLAASGADWATAAQWRNFAEGTGKRLVFRIPDIVEKGGVEVATVVNRTPRYGKDIAPQAIYRPRF